MKRRLGKAVITAPINALLLIIHITKLEEAIMMMTIRAART
jgi:hypothetical protein